jgi:hypothetical protein
MNKNNEDRVTECRAFLSFSDYAEDENKIYFANTNYNAMTIVNKTSWEVEAQIPFDGVERTGQNIHLQCIKVRNKICFLPAQAKYVHIFDTESGKQQICKFIKEPEANPESWSYFLYDNQVYLLPCQGALGLWHWKVDKDVIERETWWNCISEGAVLKHGVMDEESFYTLEVDSDRVNITNIASKITECILLPDSHVIHIAYDCEEQNFWYIVNDSKDIVCWNNVDGVVDRYTVSYDDRGIIGYLNICCIAGKLFLISADGESLYLLDKDNKTLIKIYSIECIRGVFFSYEMMPYFKIRNNQLICMIKNAGEVVLVDLESLEITQYNLKFKLNADAQSCMKKILFDRKALLLEEKGVVDLHTLLEYCMKDQ